ncbi:putative porin [Belliella kenyensis]|nr:putative porin [Belliella kenyensis]MCH7403015.1 putative porin [Belliella kenyensis]MDN3605051.1 putative porin [Belliella kenyensis]
MGNTRQETNRENEDEQEQQQDGRKKLIDDSTKMVFGPKTTLYFLEKDVRRNRIKKYEVDTLLNNFHYYEPVAKSGWKYQDLGNVGSAAQHIFYQAPVMIGTTSGFHAYDLYHQSTDSVKYYDTKSPFTNMELYFGGGNRNMMDLEFARNVTPKWNVGFTLNTIRARKTLNPNRRDDNQAVKNAYVFHTSYKSDNDKYLLLANFSRTRHQVAEQGGIIPPDVDSTSLYFTYEDAKVWLRGASAVDLRQDIHVYQEYEILKGWQAYHVFDKRRQQLSFRAGLGPESAPFFDRYNPERFNRPDSTINVNDFSEWRNELGFKGDFGPVYYNAFAKFRTGRMKGNYQVDPFGFDEFSVGGALRGEISERWRFEAEGEYLIPGAFRIHGKFISPFLEATYTKALYKPTAMQMLFRGNHHRWSNRFSNIGLDQVQGVIKADFKRWSVRPNVTINRLSNFVYFDENQQAAQANGDAFMLIPGVKTSFNVRGKLFWETEAYYTLITGGSSDIFRIPEVFANSRVYFDSPMFEENLFVQIGIEGRYRSEYRADFYNPALQQFYLQGAERRFLVAGYPILDFFLNVRINRTRVLVRYNHINDNLLSVPGYFVTPDYTGLRGMLDIGISWPLFD